MAEKRFDSILPSLYLSCTLLLAGCNRDIDLNIPFAAGVHGVPFSCAAAADGFTAFDLRFYVHHIELIDSSGASATFQLADDGVWQNGGVALLDFENGSGDCSDGTLGTHTTLTGRVQSGNYIALRFVLGVPFERNHADATLAEPPLNLGRMHWGWQGGYKFFRFEGEDRHGAFRLHLGSTGCEGTIGNITRCARPNRAAIEVKGFEAGHSRVELDLGALLPANDDLRDGAKPTSCMSEIDDVGCPQAFRVLGLNLQSGEPSGVQSLFSARPS